MGHQDLIIFLAKCANRMYGIRCKALACTDYESMRTILAMDFPVVQGLSEQELIRKIGELNYNDEEAWAQALDFLEEMEKNGKS